MRASRILLRIIVVSSLIMGMIACTSPITGRGSVGQRRPFGQGDVDHLIRSFATVGIGVYHPGDSRPEVPINGRVSPMRLTDEQAAAAALGTWAHAGISGAGLDQLVPGTALRSNAPRLPTAAVVAGWASAAHTPAARLARSFLGRQEWRSFESLVFPSAVLTLFASDVAGHALAAAGSYQRVPAGYSRPLSGATTGGVCTGTLDFINGTITKVFDAIGHLDTNTNVFSKLFGGLAGQILDGITSFGIALINHAIDAARTFVVDGVKIVLGPFLNVLATIAGTVAVATQIGQLLQPWAPTLVADPASTTRGVTRQGGRVRLTVTTASGPTGDWPPVIEDCAAAVHVTLPPLRPHGGRLTWNVDSQAPQGLVGMTSSDAKLTDAGTAAMHYLTTTEDAETAKGRPRPGFVLPEVNIHRTDLDEILDKLTHLIANALPDVPSVVKNAVGDLLSGAIGRALDRIGLVIKDQHVQAQLVVVYHSPGKDRPTGRCGRPAAGTYRGPITMSGTVRTSSFALTGTGTGSAALTVSPRGRLSGTWSLRAHENASGSEPDGTPVEAHVIVTTTGRFSGTLARATTSGTADESGTISAGAVHLNGRIISGFPFSGHLPLTVCPPTISARYDVPVSLGRASAHGTTVFTLVRR